MDSGAFPPANSTIVGAISMLRIGLWKKRTFVMPRENTSPQKGPQAQMSSNIWPQKVLIEWQFNWKWGQDRETTDWGVTIHIY